MVRKINAKSVKGGNKHSKKSKIKCSTKKRDSCTKGRSIQHCKWSKSKCKVRKSSKKRSKGSKSSKKRSKGSKSSKKRSKASKKRSNGSKSSKKRSKGSKKRSEPTEQNILSALGF